MVSQLCIGRGNWGGGGDIELQNNRTRLHTLLNQERIQRHGFFDDIVCWRQSRGPAHGPRNGTVAGRPRASCRSGSAVFLGWAALTKDKVSRERGMEKGHYKKKENEKENGKFSALGCFVWFGSHVDAYSVWAAVVGGALVPAWRRERRHGERAQGGWRRKSKMSFPSPKSPPTSPVCASPSDTQLPCPRAASDPTRVQD